MGEVTYFQPTHDPMALTLTSDDLSRIRAAQDVLLAPLAEPSPAAWGRQVIETLVAVFGAQSGLIHLPFTDTPVVERGVGRDLGEVFDHFVVEPKTQGVPFPDPIMEWSTRRRLALGVHSLSYRRLDDFLGGGLKRSAFLSETQSAHPHCEVAVLLADLLRDGAHVEGAVHLYFGTDPSFGDGMLDVQDLLVPALKTGVGTLLDLGAQRATLDALGLPLAVYDVDGRTVHRTPALGLALADDPLRLHVEAALEALARDLGGSDLALRPERTVDTPRGHYGLSGTAFPRGGAFGPRPHVLIRVRPPAQPWPEPATLRERFGLTRREAEVALLLARGLANDAVADALFVSPHTARRHTERVMSKLGVAARGQVAAALLHPEAAAV